MRNSASLHDLRSYLRHTLDTNIDLHKAAIDCLYTVIRHKQSNTAVAVFDTDGRAEKFLKALSPGKFSKSVEVVSNGILNLPFNPCCN